MDKKEGILELFLGLIFVALLVIISILVIGMADGKQTAVQTSNSIQNSYNVNSYNQVVQKIPVETSAARNVPVTKRFVERPDYGTHIVSYVRKGYTNSDNYQKSQYLRYTSYGEHTQEKTFFNNYRDEFNVYVVNKDYAGGYFKVKFAFCDYYDNCFSETIEKYIPAKEEAKFTFMDVQNERYKYHNWEYKVFPDVLD